MKNKLYAGLGVATLAAAAAALVIVQLLFVWVLFRCGAVSSGESGSCAMSSAGGLPPLIYWYFALSLLLVLCVASLGVFFFRTRRLYADQTGVSENYHRISAELFSRIETGVVVLDAEFRVLLGNAAAEKILDRAPGSVKAGQSWAELADPVLVPVAERLADALDRGEALSREFRVFLPSGVRCVRLELNRFEAPLSGTLFALFLTDNTREDEIKQKLVQQLEETHRHSAAKDNFFANMSHEIRTPINAILGMTYFAKAAAGDGGAAQYIEKIESASDILLGIVNDILDFSKMQQHKFSLNPEVFNLHDLHRIVMDLFADKARRKGLDFSVNIACPETFFVYADQFRLTQVFMNLVSNAIKFTDRGLVHVSANVETVAEDIILRCAVRDTGCGLDEEEVSRLFNDYEQFGKVLLKANEGTGLGLSISKRLVELMHGVIWVDSTPGKGSIFHFVVVLKRSGPKTAPQGRWDIPRVELKSKRVLVVEDNEINAEIAGTLLGECGCTVEFAADGLEAVETCRSREKDYFDLVLMDIHMPRMNGYDAARLLKEDIRIQCPILAVTATSDNSDTLESNRDVIAGYLPKPYKPGVFRAVFGLGNE